MLQLCQFGRARSPICLLLLVAAILTGCTASHYRKQADKDVYRILRDAQKEVHGETNAFSIETPTSSLKPEDVTPDDILQQRLQPNRRELSLDEAINLAIQHSRRYQAEKERLYQTALTLTGQRHQFAPQLFGRTQVRGDRLANGERTGSLGTDVGVSQRLKTGGTVGLTIVNDLFSYYTGNPRRSAISSIAMNLTQPILRGFGSKNPAVEALTQAERNVIYAVRTYAYFQDQFAFDVVGDYFALLAQKDTVRNRYTNYLMRVESTERLRARSADRESAADVDQTAQAELSAKNNYVNAISAYENALDQFKIALGIPVTDRVYLDDSLLREIETTGMVPVSIDPEQAFRVAVSKQYLILNAIDQFEDSKRKIKVAADRLRPDLNIFADASLRSEEPVDYTRFNPDEIRAGVGVQLDLPFDRLSERNAYRSTLISFDTAVRDLGLTFDELRDNIERGLRTLELRRQTYEIQRNAMTLAERRVESARLLLEAGREEVRTLVEAQDALIVAQNAVTTALVGYQEQRLLLMLQLGILNTEGSRFWLRDHLTEELRAAAPQAGPRLNAEAAPVKPHEVFER